MYQSLCVYIEEFLQCVHNQNKMLILDQTAFQKKKYISDQTVTTNMFKHIITVEVTNLQ